jgi:hypothetical protein
VLRELIGQYYLYRWLQLHKAAQADQAQAKRVPQGMQQNLSAAVLGAESDGSITNAGNTNTA